MSTFPIVSEILIACARISVWFQSIIPRSMLWFVLRVATMHYSEDISLACFMSFLFWFVRAACVVIEYQTYCRLLRNHVNSFNVFHRCFDWYKKEQGNLASDLTVTFFFQLKKRFEMMKRKLKKTWGIAPRKVDDCQEQFLWCCCVTKRHFVAEDRKLARSCVPWRFLTDVCWGILRIVECKFRDSTKDMSDMWKCMDLPFQIIVWYCVSMCWLILGFRHRLCVCVLSFVYHFFHSTPIVACVSLGMMISDSSSAFFSFGRWRFQPPATRFPWHKSDFMWRHPKKGEHSKVENLPQIAQDLINL